ncbi:MAG: hypothetical protein OEV15_10530 [Gallionella sp.]|nr:hypothetical protein [Gallionella sp.]
MKFFFRNEEAMFLGSMPGYLVRDFNLEKAVGWISAAHPPCQLKKVDALRLSTLHYFPGKFASVAAVQPWLLAAFRISQNKREPKLPAVQASGWLRYVRCSRA